MYIEKMKVNQRAEIKKEKVKELGKKEEKTCRCKIVLEGASEFKKELQEVREEIRKMNEDLQQLNENMEKSIELRQKLLG